MLTNLMSHECLAEWKAIALMSGRAHVSIMLWKFSLVIFP